MEKQIPASLGYAGDHQVYMSFRPIPSTIQTDFITGVEKCAVELWSGMISNTLIVNNSKTEFLIFKS